MNRARRPLALGLAAAALAVLSGCSATVALEPADDANNPLCAAVTVRLPDSIAGEERRYTDAQATGAWGSPASIIYTCGVTPPGPTEQQCITVGGIDWIVDDSEAPIYLVTSYGRDPAVQVYIDNEVVSPNEALASIGSIVGAQIDATSECVSTSTLVP